MEILFVATDSGVVLYNPSNKKELLKFNTPAKTFCLLDDEIIIAHKDKPMLVCYKLHRAQQSPKKIIMSDKVSALCAAPVGKLRKKTLESVLFNILSLI